MGYIDPEKLKAIIKAQIAERKKWMKDIDRSARQDQLWSDLNGEDMSILQIIDSLQQEQPSSNLDEVAEEYANKEHPDEPSVGQWGTGDYEPPIDREYLRELAKDAFKKGAGWQEKQDELAWRDLQKLDIIANKLWQDGKYDKNDAQEFYTEVLKRFKEYKEQKSK